MEELKVYDLLPNYGGKSKILNDDLLAQIVYSLPAYLRTHDWHQFFNPMIHGYSFE
jgi:hypothetical protein